MHITVIHCRKAGYCLKGVKEWCKRNGIDYKNFLKNGIDSNELPNDYYVDQLMNVDSSDDFHTEADTVADTMIADISEE